MPDPHTEQTYRKIINRLHSLRTQWRFLILSQGLLHWLGLMTVALSIALVIDQVFPLPRTLRMGLVVLVLSLGAYTAIRLIISPVFSRLATNRVAAYVERTYPGFQNRILSTIQLHPEMERNRFGYALEFIDELIEQTRESIDQVKPSRIFEQEFLRIKKYAGFMTGGIVLLLVINVISPSAIGDFVQAFKELPKSPQEMLIVRIDDIRPGSTRVETGADVTILAKITGHLGAAVHLYYRVGQPHSTTEPTKHIWRSILMTRGETVATYHVTIQNVTQSVEYYIKTKGTESNRYQITASREPIVSRFRLKLNFPKYTQLSSEILEENLGDVTALTGTEVRFNGEANKPLAYGNKLVFHQSGALILNTSERFKLTGIFFVQQREKYHIELIDTHGMTNSEPIVYTINTVRDAEPKVEIIEPGRDLVLDDSMIVTLKIESKDDYGLTELRLIYHISGKDENFVTLPLKQYNPPRTAAHINFSWDIDPIGLYPEDVIAYHVEAIDADNVTGPNIGKSGTYTLRFPSLDELYTEIELDQKGEQEGLEALFDEQAEAITIVDKLLETIRKSQSLSAKDEQLMQQVLEKQRQIEQAAEALVKNMKGTTEQIKRNELFDVETVEKYQELQELIDDALSEKHKELLRKLSEALEQQQLSEQDRKLMEANFNQKQFLQQLDQLKELYKQMILQQKLEASANQAQNLAERQTRLMQQLNNLIERVNQTRERKRAPNAPCTDNKDPANLSDETRMASSQRDLDSSRDELAEQENQVSRGMDALHEKLDELGHAMSEQANLARVSEEVKRLNQFARNERISPNLRKASSQMKHSHLLTAMEPGQKAQNALGDLAQGLNNALEFMEGANADETLTALQAAVRSGIYLSKAHESVIGNTNELLQSGHGQYIHAEIKRLQALSAKELSTAAGIEKLATQLWELGKQQMQVDPKVVWRLNEASDALYRAARALEDRKPNLAAPLQKQCLAGLNQAVAELLHAMNQMNQRMGMAGMQNMLEQLEQLSQNQEQLNEMSKNLSQQIRQQGRTPVLEQMLKQMGYEQQLIREATERLAQMMEQFSQALGDLRSVAEQMKQVERELDGGKINQAVLEKQRQILTRMLESSRSLQKNNVSKKRQSKTPKTLTTPLTDVPKLDVKLTETIQQLDLNLRSGAVESVPLQYREQIERYFKALSEQTQKRAAFGRE